MIAIRRCKKALLATLVAGGLVLPCLAQHPAGHQAHAPHPTETTVVSSDIALPDVSLIDQHGQQVRVYSDLVRGKIVAINFIFTTCTTICPPMGANFGRLQKLLGDHLGDDVLLLSVSTDPVTDTPERLKAWSERFGARPGWTLLTGPKQDVDRVLKALGVYTADKTDHTPFLLLGDEASGTWTRVHGFTAPAEIEKILSEMLAAGTIQP